MVRLLERVEFYFEHLWRPNLARIPHEIGQL